MPPSYSILQSAPSQREDLSARISFSRRRRCRASGLIVSTALLCLLTLTPRLQAEDSASSSLPDAPQAQTAKPANAGRENVVFGVRVGPAYPAEAGKWDTIINPGERASHLSNTDKLLYAGHEQIQPVIFAPAILSAAWGQLTDANPHYGVDAGGFGERFGSAMLRQATDRLSGDGVFALAFHQDPRFYREGNGSYVHRGWRAARQALFRRSDDGAEQINYSGLLGHAASNYLAMTYYPKVSAGAGVATEGFATTIAGDMGSRLIQEFGPDLLRLAFRRNQ
jgi:hypothetical protein